MTPYPDTSEKSLVQNPARGADRYSKDSSHIAERKSAAIAAMSLIFSPPPSPC